MLGCRPFWRAGVSHSLYHDCQAQGQDHASSSATRKPRPIAAKRDRNRPSAEAKLAELKRRLLEIGDLTRRGCRARLGPGHVHAQGRGGRAGQARRDLEPAGAREVHRPGARQAARRPCASCRAPALRQRRCEPHPHRAPRLRQGDQGAGRVRRPLERVRLRLLRCLDARASGQRFRHHASAAREGTRLQPPIRRLLRALQAHRRPADRRPRRGHDDGVGAGAVQGAARSPGADRARHRRAAAGRRQLPARLVSGGGADGVRPRRHQALRLRPRPRAARQDAPSVLHASSRPATCASPRACAATISARRCSRPCTRPATRSTSRASAPSWRARRWARAPPPACTRASRGCGRTWSAAAAASGSISIRSCALPSRTSSSACRSRRSTAPSTRSSAR